MFGLQLHSNEDETWISRKRIFVNEIEWTLTNMLCFSESKFTCIAFKYGYELIIGICMYDINIEHDILLFQYFHRPFVQMLCVN